MKKENNQKLNIIQSFFIALVVGIIMFGAIYFIQTDRVNKRLDKALTELTENTAKIYEYAIEKNNNIYTNKNISNVDIQIEFKFNEQLRETLNNNNSMFRETINNAMKNNIDLINFWFAFLSVIMVVFTLLGIFINNQYVEISKSILGDTKNQAEESIRNMELKAKNSIEFTIHFNNGYLYLNVNNFKASEYYFNEAIKLDENNAEAYNCRGWSRIELGNCLDGISDCQKAISINPNLAFAYSNIAFGYINLQRYTEAIEYANKALERDNNLALAYLNRGFANIKLENYSEGIDDCKKVIELNPNQYKAYNNIYIAYTEMYDKDKDKSKLIEMTNLFIEYHKDRKLEVRQFIVNIASIYKIKDAIDYLNTIGITVY